MSRRITRSDKIEFVAYLRGCTADQRRAVLDKERDAGRETYARLARDVIAELDS